MPRKLADWLETYMVYTAESESPDMFHMWCGASAIASVLRRNVFFDMAYFSLYPNLYVVLVSPPGRCKKSTAMRVARELLEPIPGMTMSSDSTTRERLIQDLATSFKDGYSAMTAHSSEFASMLTSSGMDMVVFLTDIFDSPSVWSHRTKVGGTQEIKAPCLNLLGGTTPDWISKAMPLDTIGIGLTSRVLFVYQDTPRVRDPFPELSPAQKQLKQLLMEDLVAMANIHGEYVFSPDAKEYYRQWYKDRSINSNPTGDSRLSGYFERKPMHLIKYAMVLSASIQDETIITLPILIRALKMLEQMEPLMLKVFSGVGKNPLNQDIEEVFAKLLTNADGISFAELLDQMRYSVRKEELVEVLDSLIVMGHVESKGGRYYSTR